MIRAAGYQVRGDGHHHHTFAAVNALALPGLSEPARNLNGIRQKRHGAIYDWEARLDDKDAEEIRAYTLQLLRAAESWLRIRYPKLQPSLAGTL